VRRIQAGEVEEAVALAVGRGEEDLAELNVAARFGVGGDALQRAHQAAVAHAVGDHMHLLGAAVGGEVHQEIGDRPPGLDARLVDRIGGDAAARGPTEEGGGTGHPEVEADLHGADRGFLETRVEAVQEEPRLRRVDALLRVAHRLLDFVGPVGALLGRQPMQSQPVVAQIEAQQFLPERRTRLAEAITFRDQHFRPTVRRARVPLAADATAAMRIAVRAEPYRIDRCRGRAGLFEAALGAEDVRRSELRAGWRLV
jgi:hypothetical protein